MSTSSAYARTDRKSIQSSNANSNALKASQASRASSNVLNSSYQTTTHNLPLLPPLIYLFTADEASARSYQTNSGLNFEVILYGHSNAEPDVSGRLHSIFTRSLMFNQQVLIVHTLVQFRPSSPFDYTPVEVEFDICAEFNKAISMFFAGRDGSKLRLRNIFIINETDDLNHVVFNYEQHVRSITNVFFCPSHFSPVQFGTVPKFEKFIKNHQLATTLHSLFDGDKFTAMIPTRGSFSYRIFWSNQPNSDTIKLRSTWWFKLFRLVPRCAEGRLLQQAGTCWWNATMNSLILTYACAELMRRKWRALDPRDQRTCRSISLRKCPATDMTFPTFMFILIYHILVKGDRTRSLQGQHVLQNFDVDQYRENVIADDISTRGANFTLAQLGNMKHVNAHLGTKKYIRGNDGGQPNQAITPIANVLFDAEDFKIIHLLDFEFVSIRDGFGFECLTSQWRETPALKERSKAFKSQPNPKFVILNSNESVFILRAPQSISIDNRTYILESAIISTPGHAITGFSCVDADVQGRKQRYIFDSETNILTMDDWPNANLEEFAKALQSQKRTKSREFRGFEYLVYVFTELSL